MKVASNLSFGQSEKVVTLDKCSLAKQSCFFVLLLCSHNLLYHLEMNMTRTAFT